MTKPALRQKALACAAATALVVAGAAAASAMTAAPAISGKQPAKARHVMRAVELTNAVRAGKGPHTSDRLMPSPGAQGAAAHGRALRAPADSLDATAGGSPVESTAGGSHPTTLATPDPRCTTLGLDATQTNDHTWILWEPVPEAVSYSVYRQRKGGAFVLLAGDLPPERDTHLDKGHDPDGLAAYTVQVNLAGETYRCTSADTVDWMSLSMDDGWGYSDGVFAGDSELYEQNDQAWGMPAASARSATPAYSPDGQLVATADLGSDDSWRLTVRRASTGLVQWSTPAPAGLVLTDPEYSPDGRYLVVGAVKLDGTSAGLYTASAHGSHALTFVPGSAGLITPAWLDIPGPTASTTLLAAGENLEDGLVLLSRTGGTQTPLANTSGGFDPVMERDGSIFYAAYDGTTSEVRHRNRAGVSTPVVSSSTDYFAWPAAQPDGDVLYFYAESPDASDPNVFTFSVKRYNRDSGGSEETAYGLDRHNAAGGFYGYDVRQPKSKGTSDLAGDGNNDILARDAGGTLWVYPMNTDTLISPRVRIGGGWQIYKQIAAAGDLNGDNLGDILAIDGSGSLWLYRGAGGATFPARTRVSGGWGSYVVVSTGDLNGDARADLVARDSGGRLWLYPGTGTGSLGARSSLGGGWNAMNAIVGSGDWNYDTKPDLLARERSTGILWLYPGTGTGRLAPRRSLGGGWNAMTAFGTPENLAETTGLLARRSDGQLLFYRSWGDGAVNNNEVYLVSGGWQSYLLTS